MLPFTYLHVNRSFRRVVSWLCFQMNNIETQLITVIRVQLNELYPEITIITLRKVVSPK